MFCVCVCLRSRLPALWCGLVSFVGWTNGSNERRIDSGDGLVVGDGVYVIDVLKKTEQGRLGDLIQSMFTQIYHITFILLSGLQHGTIGPDTCCVYACSR